MFFNQLDPRMAQMPKMPPAGNGGLTPGMGGVGGLIPPMGGMPGGGGNQPPPGFLGPPVQAPPPGSMQGPAAGALSSPFGGGGQGDPSRVMGILNMLKQMHQGNAMQGHGGGMFPGQGGVGPLQPPMGGGQWQPGQPMTTPNGGGGMPPGMMQTGGGTPNIQAILQWLQQRPQMMAGNRNPGPVMQPMTGTAVQGVDPGTLPPGVG